MQKGARSFAISGYTYIVMAVVAAAGALLSAIVHGFSFAKTGVRGGVRKEQREGAAIFKSRRLRSKRGGGERRAGERALRLQVRAAPTRLSNKPMTP